MQWFVSPLRQSGDCVASEYSSWYAAMRANCCFNSPAAHLCRALRDTGFVHKIDQPAVSTSFFLSLGQRRFFPSLMAVSSRSSVRRSGVCLEEPICFQQDSLQPPQVYRAQQGGAFSLFYRE